jgi:hypothetical protein
LLARNGNAVDARELLWRLADFNGAAASSSRSAHPRKTKLQQECLQGVRWAREEVVQRESFNTYNFAISLVAGLILFEVFFGWYLVTQDIGRVSYIRILLTSAVLIGLWVQSHAARYFGAIWLLLSVTVLIWMLFAAHKVAFNFAALLTFVCGGLSFVASYILLFSKKFKVEYARQEELQPHYKRMLRRGRIALVILLFVVAILHDIYHLLSA